MTFFDTLKDPDVKAMFRVLAPVLFPMRGRPWSHFVNDLTFEERVKVFTVVNECLRAIGADKPDPMYQDNGEILTGAQILARYTRPDND